MSGAAEPPLRIGVIGGSAAPEALLEKAEAVGRAIAEAGAVVVCGGRSGVMEAAARGAHRAGGTVVGLLPGEDAAEANRWVSLPLPTGLGEARNVLVVRASEAIVAVGGGWGTLSELALARVFGRPVVLVAPPEAGPLGFGRIDEPVAAVRHALESARRGRGIPHG